MTLWIEVGRHTEILRKRKSVVQVNGADVVLFSHDGRIFAMADLCIHKQKRLSKGLVFKGKAICPGHQWAFDLETGWADEWSVCQPTYAVKVEDEAVFVASEPRIHFERPA
ncbi:Rieske (2Fe-2S) protein [soil metagenome]